jgi:hypothetical protein
LDRRQRYPCHPSIQKQNVRFGTHFLHAGLKPIKRFLAD